jgi:adenosine deaminase
MDLSALPKVELHCHMDGILDPEMARELQRDNASFPVSPEGLEKAYPVTNMANFFKWWDFIRPIQGTLTHFYPIVCKHIERLVAQNIRYAELMISAGELPDDTEEALDRVHAFREWVDRQESGKIQIEFLVAIGRNRTPENLEEIATRILKLHEASLVAGVALAGPEIGYPVKPFQRTFARFHEAGLGIEIHAGEWCGPESVWDAIEYGYPDRIGHGTSLFQDARLVELLLEKQMHIEFCLTSNLKTGSIQRIEKHPVKKARDIGLNFSINTDDPGPFRCSLESECRLLIDVFGFGERDLKNIARNSLAARFQPVLRHGDIPES